MKTYGSDIPVLPPGTLWPNRLTCPAYGGRCKKQYAAISKGGNPMGNCRTWLCPSCKRLRPWCQGTSETELCDDCATKEEQDAKDKRAPQQAV